MTSQILVGDALETLRTLESDSVQCCMTSPPYWGLRDYGTAQWGGGDPECDHKAPPTGGPNPERYTPGGGEMFRKANDKLYTDTCGKCGARRVDAQLGLESTPEEHVAAMVAVFEEVRRVLRPDGTLWLNYGDCYAAGHSDWSRWEGGQTFKEVRRPSLKPQSGLKPKDLVGMPWRVAFALQAAGADTSSIRAIDRARTAIIDAYDGQPLPDRALDALDRLAVEYEGAKGQSWWLRSDIIWHKPNPMPESVTDRPTKAHEYVFLLTKSARYYYDADAVREDGVEPGRARNERIGGANGHTVRHSIGGMMQASPTRNARSVWTIPTQAFSEAHFATFPEELAARCVLAGTSEYGACAACGAPWERVVEKKFHGNWHPSGKGANTGPNGQTADRKGKAWDLYELPKQLGFRPACACGTEERRPCVVLDPFCGSGTTGLVAARYGRSFVGIELNPEYAAMARRRIAPALAQPALLEAG